MVYAWSKFKQLILPDGGFCLLCQSATPAQDLCPACRRDLPWNTHACTLCALPLAAAQSVCGACLASPPPYRCRTVFRYAFPLDRLVARLKYHGQLAPARVLGELLAEAGGDSSDGRPDILLPVPLHPERLAERGYNQATELARPLARRLGLPLEQALVRRDKATIMQKGLSAAERERNLRRAFSVDTARYEALGRPRAVMIVDDVVTTGATITTLANALLKTGVETVSVLALTRAS
jgi:ComF family protein